MKISCLRWTGSPDDWAIGIYKASTEQYTENEFPWSSGPLTGTPEQGIDETLASTQAPSREVITPSGQPQNCESRDPSELRNYKIVDSIQGRGIVEHLAES